MAGSQTEVRGSGPGCGAFPHPMENTWVNKDGTAKSLVAELEARLADVESLGALIAAAHLEAAIEALCRELGLPREASDTD
jgi:hypothetical protein